MKLSYSVLESELEFTFAISRSASTSTRTVIVTLEHEGLKGYGEAVYARYYNQSEIGVTSFYDKVTKSSLLEKIQLDKYALLEPAERLLAIQSQPNELEQCLQPMFDEKPDPDLLAKHQAQVKTYGAIFTKPSKTFGFKVDEHLRQQELISKQVLIDNQAALAGIDMALYDLRCKALGIPLYAYLGLDPTKCPRTSYTIGLADLETIETKVKAALDRGYDILKIKLGSDQDLQILKTIRRLAPKAKLRVDANAAWDLRAALRRIEELAEFDIEFIEEPLKIGSSESDYAELYTRVGVLNSLRKSQAQASIELMADESCHHSRDIEHCAKYFHSINIKHTKSGGITETLKMIRLARAHGLKIMLGCFTETSLSIAAFAHISPLVDYADLDGSLLLKNDPHNCISFEGNKILLSQRAGLGFESDN